MNGYGYVKIIIVLIFIILGAVGLYSQSQYDLKQCRSNVIDNSTIDTVDTKSTSTDVCVGFLTDTNKELSQCERNLMNVQNELSNVKQKINGYTHDVSRCEYIELDASDPDSLRTIVRNFEYEADGRPTFDPSLIIPLSIYNPKTQDISGYNGLENWTKWLVC